MRLPKTSEIRGGGNLRVLIRAVLGGKAAFSAVALCMAFAPVAASGATAKWKNNDGGDMNDAANWVDGYIPQAGDTLDFSALTANYKGIVPISDDVQYETMTGFTVSLSRSDAARNWNFKYINSPGCDASGFNFWGNAHLNVEGKISYTGEKEYFISDTADLSTGGVTADEFEYTGPMGRYIVRAPNNNWGSIRARTFIHNGTGHLFLSSKHNSGDHTKARYVIGSGGFTFGDTQANSASRYYYIAYVEKKARTVRIDPSADYSFAANPTRDDNMAVSMSNQCALELGTSDFDNPSISRTITCIGGIGGYLSGMTVDKVNISIDGCGTIYFNTSTGNARFPGTIKVKDTATFVLKDTATTATGPMVFDSGTTLKAVQTGAAGTVELGGSVTLAADSVIVLDFATGATSAPLRLNGLALPESGTVKLKVTNSPGGKCTLIDNLPPEAAVENFEFAEKPYPNAKLYIEDGRLNMKPAGLIIIVQ